MCRRTVGQVSARYDRIIERVRELDPGYFAVVMATGILATACRSLGLTPLFWLFLAIGLIAYLALIGLNAVRFVHHRSALAEDIDRPERVFGFFAFVAGSNVLAATFLQVRFEIPAYILGAIGVGTWLVLTYVIPLRLIVSFGQESSQEFLANWLLWVVATQSVAVVFAEASALGRGPAPAFATIGLMIWGIGIVLYGVLICFVMSRLLLAQLTPAQLTPPYWINMGAAAISVLAGSLLLHLGTQDQLLNQVRPFVAGFSLTLWAWASWWIPALALLGLWRHWLRSVPLNYVPAFWSMIFPLGMYAAASVELGRSIDQAWLVTLARLWLPVALLAWLWTFVAMLLSWRRPSELGL